MAVLLEDFMKDAAEHARLFELVWRYNNKKDPEHWPMSFEDDNDGLWWESFIDFDPGDYDIPTIEAEMKAWAEENAKGGE